MNMEMISVGRLALCAVDVYMLYSFFKTMFKLRNYNVIMYVLFSVMVTFQIFFIISKERTGGGLNKRAIFSAPLFSTLSVFPN